jgi:hypothetical protein
MSALGSVPEAPFSLQYPDLTPSHAEYAKIRTRSSFTSVEYWFVEFKYARRWPENSSGEPNPEQLKAYNRDVEQLGDLFNRLVVDVGIDQDAASSSSLTPPFPSPGVYTAGLPRGAGNQYGAANRFANCTIRSRKIQSYLW